MGFSPLARGLFSRRSEHSPEADPDPLAFLAEVADRVPIALAPLRQVSTVAGRVESATPSPEGRPAQFLVSIQDGSGPRLEAVWLGRRSIAGIGEGVGLSVRGTVALAKGTRRIVDPSYTLISEA